LENTFGCYLDAPGDGEVLHPRNSLTFPSLLSSSYIMILGKIIFQQTKLKLPFPTGETLRE
jgi:hypothetical protein